MARYTKGGDVVRVPQINAELEKIEQAFENVLSRDGDAPNQMNAPIDMNGNKIVNVQTDITDPNSLVQRSDLYVKSEVEALDAQAVLDANAFAVNQDNAVLAAAQAYAEELAGEPVNTVRYVQEDLPVGPIISGARWYKPSEGVTYVYYVDGDSSQWVQETVNSFEGTLRTELADVNSDVLVGGVEAGDIAKRNGEVISASVFGLQGDGSDETALLESLITAFNASAKAHTLIFEKGKTYKFNGTSLSIASDKTVDAKGATFITDTSDLLFITSGTFDSHVENVVFRNIKTVGFADPIQLLFADNSLVEWCECDSPSNIGIQVKGDELVNNVVRNNVVYNAGFHCFATNDSLAFNPANTSQGQRYPKDTSFIDNVAIGATNLAYNVHSHSEGGITRVTGGRILNCNQIAKNSFGTQIYSDIKIIKEGVAAGTTWLWQVGANSAEGDSEAVCTIKDCTIEIDQPESLFLLQGDCNIQNNTVVYKGTNDLQVTYFQINNNVNTKRIKVVGNTFKGNNITYTSSNLLNDNGASNAIQELTFENNSFENLISLAAFDDAVFDFASSSINSLSISDNSFNFSGVGGRFALFAGTTIASLYIQNNDADGVRNVILFSGGSTEVLYFQNNSNIGYDNRAATVVKNTFVDGNTPRNMQLETPSNSLASASRLVTGVDNGAEYKVLLSTDLSSSNSSFTTQVEYNIMVARDGLSLATGNIVKVGTESNIGAQFQLNGGNLEYATANALLHYINVTKVNDR